MIRTKLLDRRGASAVEFAIVLPFLLVMLFGIVCYGIFFATLHSIQQLASEAARASVAGISAQERDSIARGFVSDSIGSYPMLQNNNVVVSTTEGTSPDYSFTVLLKYDLSKSYIYQFSSFIPLPGSQIIRSAVIRRGGY